MITTLHIKNIGIIQDITINFNNGFNVLTGETGSGKSLLIDSLSIIAGGRFSKEMIRNSENYSFVEICIFDPNSEYAQNSNIIVTREMYLNGKNSCKINGRLVTVNELKEFMREYIDIHSQNENQMLMQIPKHIECLDAYAGESIKGLKDEYLKLYMKYNQLKEEIGANYGDEKEKKRMLDILYYELNEINEAKLKISEEEELELSKKIMLSSEKIMNHLELVGNELQNNILSSFETCIKSLGKLEGFDTKYTKQLEIMQNSYYELQDISGDIEDYKCDMEFDESKCRQVEDRLDLIYRLKRKYGNNISEILEYRDKIKGQIGQIEGMEEYVFKLNNELSELKTSMLDISRKMNEVRENVAITLSQNITNELKYLEMNNASFKIQVSYDENSAFSINGLNKVEFLISTNVGESYKPLVKIASGGETSRIMLALKTIFADIDKIGIVVFDEIDAGISGEAASAVSEKLKEISKSHQVLCVTHLPVIAAAADFHYYIKKEVENHITRTKVKMLDDDEIVNEIARITAGKVTKIALEYAHELKGKI